jgi:hypothetical protein
MTKQEVKRNLEKVQAYGKYYKGYPGSPGDDGLLGLPGCYTVRDERSYIKRNITRYKKALQWMEEHNTDTITDRELFYLV